MITSVCISGKLADRINDFTRYVKVEKAIPDKGCNIIYDLIPVAHFSKSCGTHFMRIPNGTFIICRGRLEMIEGVGLTVVAELYEVLSNGELKVSVEQ